MTILTMILILIGSIFILVAAIGIYRMPDLLMCMHTATKAGTLGAGLSLVGVMIYFHKWSVTVECILAIFFIFITAPIASHLLARASYLHGIKLARLTVVDEFKDYLKNNSSKEGK